MTGAPRFRIGARMTRAVEVATGGQIGAVLARRLVQPVFQPIVELSTRAVVGLEALARGPAGSALEFPDRLFAAAPRRRAGNPLRASHGLRAVARSIDA